MALPSAMVACIYKRTADTRFTECPTWSICQDGFLRKWYSYTPQGLSPLSDLDFLFSPPAEKVKELKITLAAPEWYVAPSKIPSLPRVYCNIPIADP